MPSAAAFGRLCVETSLNTAATLKDAAAAFGRLCVETATGVVALFATGAAAFGRLCVETTAVFAEVTAANSQPPSGGCVLKPLATTSL